MGVAEWRRRVANGAWEEARGRRGGGGGDRKSALSFLIVRVEVEAKVLQLMVCEI